MLCSEKVGDINTEGSMKGSMTNQQRCPRGMDVLQVQPRHTRALPTPLVRRLCPHLTFPTLMTKEKAFLTSPFHRRRWDVEILSIVHEVVHVLVGVFATSRQMGEKNRHLGVATPVSPTIPNGSTAIRVNKSSIEMDHTSVHCTEDTVS